MLFLEEPFVWFSKEWYLLATVALGFLLPTKLFVEDLSVLSDIAAIASVLELGGISICGVVYTCYTVKTSSYPGMTFTGLRSVSRIPT